MITLPEYWCSITGLKSGLMITLPEYWCSITELESGLMIALPEYWCSITGLESGLMTTLLEYWCSITGLKSGQMITLPEYWCSITGLESGLMITLPEYSRNTPTREINTWKIENNVRKKTEVPSQPIYGENHWRIQGEQFSGESWSNNKLAPPSPPPTVLEILDPPLRTPQRNVAFSARH